MEGLDRLAAVLVHEHDRPRAQVSRDRTGDAVLVGPGGVEAVHAPDHVHHAQAAHGRVDPAVAQAVRRSEHPHRASGGGGHGVARALDLARGGVGGQAGERGVGPAVIAQLPEGDLLREPRGVGLEVAPDEEPRDAGVRPGELVDRELRVRAGTVVEGQRHQALAPGPAVDGLAGRDERVEVRGRAPVRGRRPLPRGDRRAAAPGAHRAGVAAAVAPATDEHAHDQRRQRQRRHAEAASPRTAAAPPRGLAARAQRLGVERAPGLVVRVHGRSAGLAPPAA